MSKSTPPETGVPWQSPTVQVVLTSTALAPLGVPLVAPALPVVRDAFALTDARASLLVSVYFLTGIVLSPFIGLLADRVGRRRVLVTSLLGFGLAGGAIAFAGDYAVVLGVRLVQGTAAAGIFITTVTLVGDAFEGVQRNAVLGVNVAVLSAGAALYPILGGALATVSWNAPFLAYLAAVPVGLLALWLLPEPRVEPPDRGGAYLRGAASELAAVRPALLYAATLGAELVLFGVALTALPFLLAADFALSPVGIGLVITATEGSATVVAAFNGRLARRLSDGVLVAAGFAGYGLGSLGAWLAAGPVAVAAAMVVFGSGFGLTLPSIDAALSDLVPAEFRAGALSLRNSTTFLGRAAGPVLFAGLAVTTGYRPLLLATGAVALAVGLVALVVAGRRTRRSRQVGAGGS